MTTSVLLGVDVGTSDSKVLVTTGSGEEILAVSERTHWHTRPKSHTDTDPEALARAVFALMDRAVTDAAEKVGPVRVAAVAFTGMAEAGVLLDAAGRPTHPIIAWFDPRGSAEVAALPAEFRREFPGRTGLPLTPMATLFKLLWMRSQGTAMAGPWFHVPEFLAHRLGAAQASELSLRSRTGLIDQDTGDLWPAALELLGAAPDLLPPAVPAGTPLGRAGGPGVPVSLRGAVVTVAGHDHPVAAVGCGSIGATQLFDSFGTAEALVLCVETELDTAARDRLATAGINAVHHVLAGRRLLLGGTKAGLVLRRTLELLGATGPADRQALDEAACTLADRSGPPAGAVVSGSDNRDGALRIVVDSDGVDPAGLWLASVDHVTAEADRVLAVMAAEVGPAGSAVVAGGWTRMRSVRRAKTASMPGARFSDRGQAGSFGATIFAAYALSVAETMHAAGDCTASAVGSPSGPTQEFVAAFAVPRADAPTLSPDSPTVPVPADAVDAREPQEIHS